MTPDDALYRFRLRALALAGELGSASAACRMLGIRRSTFCRRKARAGRGGGGMLRPRERRRPRMPNAASPLTEQRGTVAEPGAEQRFIRSGRPRTNGCVERVQDTILEAGKRTAAICRWCDCATRKAESHPVSAPPSILSHPAGVAQWSG